MNKEQIIEEMAVDIWENTSTNDNLLCDEIAESLYKQGYRKVVMCKDCKYFFNEHFKACTYWNGHATTEINYCSRAKMRGE